MLKLEGTQPTKLPVRKTLQRAEVQSGSKVIIMEYVLYASNNIYNKNQEIRVQYYSICYIYTHHQDVESKWRIT